MTEGIYKDRGRDFHLQEYIALRAEILALLETLRTLERNVVFAVGVSWGFLASQHLTKPERWWWFVPVMFPAVAIWRVHGILRHFGEFRSYIATIEGAYAEEGAPVGWQRFTRPLSAKESNASKKTGGSDGTVAFWIVLSLSTFVIAICQVVGLF